jgi:spermidine synthase
MLLLAFATGYLSMSQEVLWFRALGYATAGRAEVFGWVLGAILTGIALGGLASARLCKRAEFPLFRASALMLVLSGSLFMFGFPIWAALQTGKGDYRLSLLFALICMMVVSALIGTVFPLACHLSIASNDRWVGRKMGWIYLANILGSTLGPLLTGFFALHYLSTSSNIRFVAAATVLVGIAIWRADRRGTNPKRQAPRLALAIALLLCLGLVHRRMSNDLLAKLHYKSDFAKMGPYERLVENRHGIIAVAQDELVDGGDVMFGGGVYDGRFNTDLGKDHNGIYRAYYAAVLRDSPKQVLMIGLATGSWARVVADYPTIEMLDIVEINPGYLTVLSDYPESASLTTDPKVRIHIDDGRRWLRRHPDRKFDAIIMNTTFHWRANATTILSKDFLLLAKQSLNDEGFIYLNPTGSDDVIRTAADVFRYVTPVGNVVAASDAPLPPSSHQLRERLQLFNITRPTFPDTVTGRKRLTEFAERDLHDQGELFRARNDLHVITDDNLWTEFKGRKQVGTLHDYVARTLTGASSTPQHRWPALLRRINW